MWMCGRWRFQYGFQYIPRSPATSASGEPDPGRWSWGDGVYIPKSLATSVSGELELPPRRLRWG